MEQIVGELINEPIIQVGVDSILDEHNFVRLVQ